MKSFHHQEIARLAHELALSPMRHRLRQLAGITRAIELIDPAKDYPYAFVCYHVTGYRQRRTFDDAVLGGKTLTADLVELMDEMTAAHPLPAEAANGSLYDSDALARRFNVSTKTISRWRRRGLAGCWYVSDSVKPHLGFSARSVERFVSRNRDLVQRGSSFQLMGPEERERIIARARELVARQKCSLHVVTVQLAQETRRAVETIRYTIRRYDRDHPELALFDRREQANAIDEDTVIQEAFASGAPIGELAIRFNKPESSIRKALTRARALQLAENTIDYIYNSAFDAPGEDGVPACGAAVCADDKGGPDVTLTRSPTNLPPYLKELYRVPLLSRAEEAELFRRMNLHLHRAELRRRGIAVNVSVATADDIAEVEKELDRAREIKNRIIQANLRLVVSIAKRHLFSHRSANLFELISDGNMSLLRAVEKFDYARGFRFSTYASWAIMRGFARSVPEELTQMSRFQTGQEELLSVAGDKQADALEYGDGDSLREMLSRSMAILDDRERRIIERHYGMGKGAAAVTLEDIGREFGISKERIRQIEMRALAKLRGALGEKRAELLAG